jgi:ubiquinone/menaquinone biosynthesis C-methylase UbiE
MSEDHPVSLKGDVRHFYDDIGWQIEETGFYQNARYEDLRPVAREYIHRAHMRVNRHLDTSGKFFLDAGSGPIQYPEYMTYSAGYQYRVCVDLSLQGLREARKRKEGHVLCVAADVANLPFANSTFDGIVSLHTIHHVPPEEKQQAFFEIYRVLRSGHRAVVVNGWSSALLSDRILKLVGWLEKPGELLSGLKNKLSGQHKRIRLEPAQQDPEAANEEQKQKSVTGTYIDKMTPAGLKETLGEEIDFRIFVWRTLNTRAMRTLIKPWLLGKFWLRLLYTLEEKYPRYFGENGQYPMVILQK